MTHDETLALQKRLLAEMHEARLLVERHEALRDLPLVRFEIATLCRLCFLHSAELLVETASTADAWRAINWDAQDYAARGHNYNALVGAVRHMVHNGVAAAVEALAWRLGETPDAWRERVRREIDAKNSMNRDVQSP